MSIWMLALIGWVVVFPAVVLAIAVVLSAVSRRSQVADEMPLADVIPFEPAARRHTRAAPLPARSDQTAPVA